MSLNCIFLLYAAEIDRSFAYLASSVNYLICYDCEWETESRRHEISGTGKKKKGYRLRRKRWSTMRPQNDIGILPNNPVKCPDEAFFHQF